MVKEISVCLFGDSCVNIKKKTYNLLVYHIDDILLATIYFFPQKKDFKQIEIYEGNYKFDPCASLVKVLIVFFSQKHLHDTFLLMMWSMKSLV